MQTHSPNTDGLGNADMVEKTLDVTGDIEECAILFDISWESRPSVSTSVKSNDVVIFLYA